MLTSARKCAAVGLFSILRRQNPFALGIAAIAVVIGFSAWAIFHEGIRIRIAAKLWQLQHHGQLAFAGHSIFVPTNWYVQNDGADEQQLIRLDSDHQPTSPYPHAIITLTDERPLVEGEIEKWKSPIIVAFQQMGADPEVRRITSADGETFACVGGELLLRPPGTNYSATRAWHCRAVQSSDFVSTSTGLEIMMIATKEDMGQNWEIVSNIRRTSQYE